MSDEQSNERAPRLGGKPAGAPTNNEPSLSLERLLPGLREALESGDRGKRLTTIEQIRTSGSVQVVPLLIELMETASDSVTRNRCAAMLGQLGDERALDALLKLIRDPDSGLRTTAIWAVGQLRSPKAVEPLIDLLNGEADGRIRSTVIVALGEIRDVQAVPVLVALREANPDTVVATNATFALKQITPNVSLSEVIKLMYSEQESAREWAMDLFGRHQAAPTEEHFPELVKLADEQHRGDVRQRAVHLLGKIDTKTARDVLMGFLASPDDKIRFAAVNSVRLEQIEQAAGILLERYGAETEAIQGAIVKALGMLHDPRILPFLINGIESDRHNWHFSEALVSYNQLDTPGLLLERLDKATGDTQHNIIHALRYFNTGRVVAKLLEIAKSGGDQEVGRVAVASIDIRAHPEAAPELIQILKSDAPDEVRGQAIWTLSHYFTPEVESALNAFMRQTDNDTLRASALSALMGHDADNYIPALREYLESIKDEDALGSLIYRINDLEPEEAERHLMRLYSNAKDFHLRCMVIEELGDHYRSVNSRAVIIQALESDPNPRVRWEAVLALDESRWGDDPVVVNALIRALNDTAIPWDAQSEGADVQVCDTVARTLETFQLPEAISALAEWKYRNSKD